jgi:hypothetical protein
MILSGFFDSSALPLHARKGKSTAEPRTYVAPYFFSWLGYTIYTDGRKSTMSRWFASFVFSELRATPEL